jgi:hypothetical protein
MGGDIQPLGVGFRNATTVADCCSQCVATPSCKFFAFAPPTHVDVAVGPKHNCWLKSSYESRKRNTGRTSGGQTLPPTPAPPVPAGDACNGGPDGCPLGAGQCPWCNVTAPVAVRVQALLSALTLAEKIAQISTYTPKTVPGVPRVGLPPFSYHSEGLHGVRCAGAKTLGLVATLFPQTTVHCVASQPLDRPVPIPT